MKCDCDTNEGFCGGHVEPTFTLAQVEAHVEKLAGLVEYLDLTGESAGEIQEITANLIRTTPIGDESV